MKELSEADLELVKAAREIIRKRRKPGIHSVGAALRTRSGRTFAAVHIEAYVARLAICAEAIAIGMAAAEGDAEIDTIVAVRHTGRVAAPCGMCRELIADYGPHARVIVPGPHGHDVAVTINELLPNKYRREDKEA